MSNLTDTIYTDLCSRFPFTFLNGNKYLFILYEYDTSYIFAMPMKNRSKDRMNCVFDALITRLNKQCFYPKVHFLDNVISKELKTNIKKNKIKFQLVPPGIKQKNNAERAIKTFMNHFIVGLTTYIKIFL